jgi:hypothetical protein
MDDEYVINETVKPKGFSDKADENPNWHALKTFRDYFIATHGGRLDKLTTNDLIELKRQEDIFIQQSKAR